MVVFEKAPAKINLTLDVLGRRPDGYHEVEMVMTEIDLADHVTLTARTDGEIRLDSHSGVIPLDERNLAWRAASRMQEAYGCRQGVSIWIEKVIPVAAGLAGGSSDAAAVLRGLNRLWGVGASLEELSEIGRELGSDIPFCLMGGTALARGRGEKVTPLPDMPACWVVLAKPPISISTSEIYGALNAEAIAYHPKTRQLIEGLERQDLAAVASYLGNVLEEVTFRLYPQVAYLKQQMLRLGVSDVSMSGSGPSVFALLDKESRAMRLYHGLKGFCKEVFVVRSLKTCMHR